jgi:hypothetical protein
MQTRMLWKNVFWIIEEIPVIIFKKMFNVFLWLIHKFWTFNIFLDVTLEAKTILVDHSYFCSTLQHETMKRNFLNENVLEIALQCMVYLSWLERCDGNPNVIAWNFHI